MLITCFDDFQGIKDLGGAGGALFNYGNKQTLIKICDTVFDLLHCSLAHKCICHC